MAVRPLARPLVRPFMPPGSVAGGGADSSRASWVQQVVDPGFAAPASWTLSGTGIGTSAVTGGVLQVTSVTNDYFVRPSTVGTPLTAGVYTVVFTVLNYVSGTIGLISSTSAALSGGTVGAAYVANGTYTENVTLPLNGYIGLGGQGAAVVNSLQVDNMTIQRVA